jgi:hypothetical protein
MANLGFDSDIDDDGDVFDPASMGKPANRNDKVEPLYRVYEGARIAVGKGTGRWWKNTFDAAKKAYETVWAAWDEALRYYNNDQTQSIETPRGVFKRGDGTENVVYSNVNTVLPAVYSKNPDITCSTTDQGDQAFCEALEAVLNTLIRRRDKLNAKPKIKRAVGFGLLTNQGVFKLDFTQKDDSREMAQAEMERLTRELAVAKKQEDVDNLYGQFQALEMRMEVLEPSGATMKNVLPQNLLVDPFAEQPDGLDGNWMIERCYLSTAMLIASYTTEDPEASEQDNAMRRLIYKPTHKAVLSGDVGRRDDGLGLVMQVFENSEMPTSNTLDERQAFVEMMYTECFYVWDKYTRRVMLFHSADWAWPLWVWDDTLRLTRFFPYFIVGYGMSTGGTTSVGDVAYYLDQQDTINDINRQRNKIRRSLFDFFFYNSEAISSEEAEKFVEAIRGNGTPEGAHLLGVKAGENKINDLIQAFLPPSAQFEHYFDTKREMDAINRVTNTSEALRGVQFKTNTNTSAVETYQESMRLAVGAKVDVVEDVVADFAEALAELCVQHYSKEEVIALIGPALGNGWREDMSLDDYKANYSLEIASGSMEKPNSIFKKKEAIEIVQAVGQFAKAAPGTTLRVILKVLEQAFTEVTIKPDDWAAIDQEVAANTQKGVTTGQQPATPSDDGNGALMQQLQALPDAVKQQVVQMKQRGASSEQIKTFLMQQLQSNQSKGTVQ